jgi:hypothetical protein
MACGSVVTLNDPLKEMRKIYDEYVIPFIAETLLTVNRYRQNYIQTNSYLLTRELSSRICDLFPSGFYAPVLRVQQIESRTHPYSTPKPRRA